MLFGRFFKIKKASKTLKITAHKVMYYARLGFLDKLLMIFLTILNWGTSSSQKS